MLSRSSSYYVRRLPVVLVVAAVLGVAGLIALASLSREIEGEYFDSQGVRIHYIDEGVEGRGPGRSVQVDAHLDKKRT